MQVEIECAQWKEEALTTWRASLATRGVVARNRHCGRREGFEACMKDLESRGKTLEAIVMAPNDQIGSLPNVVFPALYLKPSLFRGSDDEGRVCQLMLGSFRLAKRHKRNGNTL